MRNKIHTLFVNKKTIWFLFFLILVLGFVIRIYRVDQAPASPDWDEVALGYNAYSILQTGKDEYGEFLPVVLRSFDDYKPALYAYLIIPIIPFFDLSVLSVRLPAVIFGTISIAAIFFIVRELFSNGVSISKLHIDRDLLALTIMFFVSIAPWHIQFSRIAFEAQIGLSFNLLCVLFFLKGLRRYSLLIMSAICAALSIYVYQSEKVYVPLLVLLLVVVFFKEVVKIPKKWIGASIFVGFLVVLPMLIYIVTNPNSLNRAKGVSVFSDSVKLLENNKVKQERNVSSNNYLGMLMDNRRIEYARAFAAGYLSHFEPNWFFYRGDVPRHQPPHMGLLYLFEMPLILIGLYVLLFSSIKRRIKVLIIGYILIAPIPASVTFDVPHAVRTINFLPAPQILSSIGFLAVMYKVLEIRNFSKFLILAVFAGVISFNVVYYFLQYHFQMNYYYSKAWQYGWEEAVAYAVTESKNFDQIVVTNVSPLDQSYMFFLFYSKYDPKKYLQEGGTGSGGFAADHTAFENYTFRPINWNEDKFMKNTLFVGRPGDLPDNIGKTINYLDGTPAIIFSSRYE